MRVVLDSSVIVPDYWLAQTDFRVLQSIAGTKQYSLFIPSVVVEETRNKFCKALEDGLRDSEKTVGSLARFTGMKLDNAVSRPWVETQTAYRPSTRTAQVSWELRFYERYPVDLWTCHASWQLD